MTIRRLALAFGLASAVAAPQARVGADTALAVPGRSNAHVSVAADGAFVVAVWAGAVPGGSSDIFAATSRDGGDSFGPPVQVNQAPGDARVNGEQPPRVTVASRPGAAPRVTVVWTSQRPMGSIILAAQSRDGGRTFGPAAPVPGSEAAGNRGWQGVAVDPMGRTRVAWLDHREMSGSGTAGAGHHHVGHDASHAARRSGAVVAERSMLYTAVVGDVSSVKTLTGGVCYCCKTALAIGPDNGLFLAWRHVYSGNIRDIAFTMSQDGGQAFTAPARVSDDGWQLDGCPDDGPAMARTLDGRLHIVWPTLVKEARARPTIGLFYTSSGDARLFSARLELPTAGVPHHPQIASVGSSSVAVAWDELEAGKRRVVLAWSHDDGIGTTRFTREALSPAGAETYPAIASTSKGIVVAWTSGAPAASIIRLERRLSAKR